MSDHFCAEESSSEAGNNSSLFYSLTNSLQTPQSENQSMLKAEEPSVSPS